MSLSTVPAVSNAESVSVHERLVLRVREPWSPARARRRNGGPESPATYHSVSLVQHRWNGLGKPWQISAWPFWRPS